MTYTYVRSHEDLPFFGNAELDQFIRDLISPFAYTERYGFLFLWIMFFALASLGAISLLLSAWAWGRSIASAISQRPLPHPIALIAILQLFAQIYLLSVCLSVPTGLRYLLPALPFLQLACLLWLHTLLAGRQHPQAHQSVEADGRIPEGHYAPNNTMAD